MYQLPPMPVKKKPRAPYRKPEAVKRLEQMLYEDDLRRHPSMKPQHMARRKHRDDTANGLTACIVAYAKLNGAVASRLNNTGIDRNGKFTRSTASRGLPDVLVTLNGMSLFIEVKVGRDKMSHYQEAVRDDQTAAGGLYYTAHNFADFKAWFDAFAVGVVPQKIV